MPDEPLAQTRWLVRISEKLGLIDGDRYVRAIALATFVFSAGLMLAYRPFSRPEGGDAAGYDQIAQEILRGHLPYRDVVDIKGPGSPYLSAAAMSTGKLIGIRDVIAVRLFQCLLTGAVAVATFAIGRMYLGSSTGGLFAAAFPLMSSKYAEWMVVGTQPKLPMILFGMLSLWLVASDRPFWAGATSVLSFLCWQPGLLFTGAGFLVFSRYLTRWRDGRALKMLVGAAVPLAIVVAYFYFRGGLRDLWDWTIVFNYTVFRPETQREPMRALTHIFSVGNRIFGIAVVFVWMSIAGFFVRVIERVKSRHSYAGRELWRDAVLIAPVVYFMFCIINMQAGPDLILFIPFVGILAAALLIALGRWISSGRAGERSVRWDVLLSGACLGLMLFAAVGRAALYRLPPELTLQSQDQKIGEISKLLAPDDKMYVHGSVELLVLLNRPNLNPYPFLNQGIDTFVARRRSIDLSVLVDEMESQQPKIVALSRLKSVASRDLLEQWVNEKYEKLPPLGFEDVYVRKAR